MSRGEKAFWYALAGITYCGVAIFEKGLLNWIIGPIWLVAFVAGGPAVVDRIRGRRVGPATPSLSVAAAQLKADAAASRAAAGPVTEPEPQPEPEPDVEPQP
ncbi:MAG TPA: hypothetical protein VGO78_19550 [Acidimicrobiales bacterium]|nr:hypothetical protein [Acidimicrobiales bacterium]